MWQLQCRAMGIPGGRMIDPRCRNCGYEVTEVNEIEYCQTCEDAYNMGYAQARREYGD
jgi:hypothetical protein